MSTEEEYAGTRVGPDETPTRMAVTGGMVQLGDRLPEGLDVSVTHGSREQEEIAALKAEVRGLRLHCAHLEGQLLALRAETE